MRHWLFDLATGLFKGRSMDAPKEILEANRPDGFGWIDGVTDWESQRVDIDVLSKWRDALAAGSDQAGQLEALVLVDYQPPPPDDDHEWMPERKRYRLKPDVAAARQRRAMAMAEIERLEAASLRPLREVRLAEIEGRAAPNEAKARLQEIEQRISMLRADLLPVSAERTENGGPPGSGR